MWSPQYGAGEDPKYGGGGVSFGGGGGGGGGRASTRAPRTIRDQMAPAVGSGDETAPALSTLYATTPTASATYVWMHVLISPVGMAAGCARKRNRLVRGGRRSLRGEGTADISRQRWITGLRAILQNRARRVRGRRLWRSLNGGDARDRAFGGWGRQRTIFGGGHGCLRSDTTEQQLMPTKRPRVDGANTHQGARFCLT